MVVAAVFLAVAAHHWWETLVCGIPTFSYQSACLPVIQHQTMTTAILCFIYFVKKVNLQDTWCWGYHRLIGPVRRRSLSISLMPWPRKSVVLTNDLLPCLCYLLSDGGQHNTTNIGREAWLTCDSYVPQSRKEKKIHWFIKYNVQKHCKQGFGCKRWYDIVI